MRAKGAFSNLFIVTSTHAGSADNSDILRPGSLQSWPDASNSPKRLRLTVAESLRDSAGLTKTGLTKNWAHEKRRQIIRPWLRVAEQLGHVTSISLTPIRSGRQSPKLDSAPMRQLLP